MCSIGTSQALDSSNPAIPENAVSSPPSSHTARQDSHSAYASPIPNAPRSPSLMKRRAALLLPALLAGCYTYAPGEAASVQPGIGVRARISPAAAARIEPLLGTSDARLLTGTVIDNAGG